MPFASKAHRAKMRALLAEGKITLAQFEEVAKGTPANLPDRADEDTVDTDSKPKDKAKTRSPFW